ncbi:MAG: HNH endonuclease [Deltaproteobacteria bacterium]|nr:HNH endonuclease [Deltaproteobacteria bacterium]
MQSERARFASTLDAELRLACRGEATMRRELGCAARELMRRRGYRRLGFVRLGDYARERLGVSARTLQSAAWLATRLDALPAVSRAYDRSELSWAQARLICRVAVAADEVRWLALARRSTVETLERLVRRARRPEGVAPDPEGDPNEIDGEPPVRWRLACPARVRALWRRALELASCAAGEPLAEWRAAEVVAAEGSSGRPVGTAFGQRAVSLADRALITAVRLARRARREARGAGDGNAPAVEDGSAIVDAAASSADSSAHHSSAEPLSDRDSCAAPGGSPDHGPSGRARNRAPLSLAPPASSDPVALDARLVEAMRVLRTIEPRIGRSLRVVVDHRFYGTVGCASFEDYVRERLGISARKAWALLKIEKATLRSGDFARAYREGRLSWVRALSLLPVLDRENAAAWIARSELVTVRRLCDEIDWVLAARDALGPSVSLGPPPVDSRLLPPSAAGSTDECRVLSLTARLQIGAHVADPVAAVGAGAAIRHSGVGEQDPAPGPFGPVDASRPPAASEVCDAEIRFSGPTSVVALLRDVLDAFADPSDATEPRWAALERLVRHVIACWESTPRHPDPVFARDRWRCTVPACSSRRNLHDHHIRFRSRGGDNTRDNRTTVCAAHHLHGLHDGTIHATGTAPHAIEWRLGVRPGAPPFLAYVGDRYRLPATSGAVPSHGLG